MSGSITCTTGFPAKGMSTLAGSLLAHPILWPWLGIGHLDAATVGEWMLARLDRVHFSSLLVTLASSTPWRSMCEPEPAACSRALAPAGAFVSVPSDYVAQAVSNRKQPVSARSGRVRDLIRERTRDGLAATTARGRNGGRKHRLTPGQVQAAKDLRAAGRSVREIGQLLGNGKPVSRQTIYRALGMLAK